MLGPAETSDGELPEPARAKVGSDVEARQAAELRASVVRLASEKLERAEAEAAAIRREALEEASAARRRAAQLMVTRLEDAAAAGVAVRDAALEEARRARAGAAGMVEEAIERVHALHEDITDVMGRVEALLGWLSSLEDRLTALQQQLAPGADAAEESPNGAP
jgi:hypothetical protein